MMDESMTEGTLEESPQVQAAMDLIKIVRGLDQNGPGENGHNLDSLWKCLTAAADDRFHAAEESSLRWLLKSMNGPSKDAELLRRWPLTWTILECVFQRIPLFSLAKSLADRRFIAVLQQTLKDISRPASDPSSKSSSKRKRPTTKSYALDDLKDEDGCLMTGDAVFRALGRLLGRIDVTGLQSSHDRVGAEHIRSLFCTSAVEAAGMASLGLMVAGLACGDDESRDSEGRETWIETLSSIWDLHLQGSDDMVQAAEQLYRPSALILSKLEGIGQPCTSSISTTLRTKWSTNLQRLMHQNLILTSRSAFLARQDFEATRKALEVTTSNIATSAPTLYFLASGGTQLLAEGRHRKGNAEWMKAIFKAVEEAVRGQSNRDNILQIVLERAAKLSMPIDNNDLRRICREYAFLPDQTNWRLVADIATCDPDVFHLTEQGEVLLADVCERSTGAIQDSDHEPITKTLNCIVQGFRTGRDFSGFLKLWFKQLCKIDKKESQRNSPWFKIMAGTYGIDPFGALIEKELSAQQLLDVLAWVKEQKSHSRATCVFLNAIAQGVQSEAFADVVGTRLLELVSEVKKTSSPLTALKWGVVAKTISWVTSEQRTEIWMQVKKPLSKILTDAPLESRETFEAFKCCCHTWLSMCPDDAQVEEPFKLVEDFTNRFATELISSKALKNSPLSSDFETHAELDFSEETALQNYLQWFIRGSSRLNRLFSQRKEAIPPVIQNVLSSSKGKIEDVGKVWQSLLENENNMNDVKVVADLIERLTKALETDGKEKRWPEEASKTWIKSLSAIHTDAFTRPQRENLMGLLHKQLANSTKRTSPENWKLVLGLSTKLMGRPTFYEGMKFQDLVNVADAMKDISSSASTDDGALGDLITAFFAMASATVRQMAEHIEERSIKYFDEAQKYVEGCKDDDDSSPFRMTLLKALIKETRNSPSLLSHSTLAALPKNTQDVLGRLVMSATGYFMTEKKAYERQKVVEELRLLAAVDAAEVVQDLSEVSTVKKSEIRKAEKRSSAAMLNGDLRGWKMCIFLRTYFWSYLEDARPTSFQSLTSIPSKLRESLLKANISAIMRHMETAGKVEYLRELIEVFVQDSNADGQALAIQCVVINLIESSDLQDKIQDPNLAVAHSKLVSTLTSITAPSIASHVCRTLSILLEKKPQAMTQWNIELTLNTICELSAPESTQQAIVPYAWLCKLVEAAIKKHRLRLEGHHHLLMAVMESLLRDLVVNQPQGSSQEAGSQESKAHLYARLVTLICEPTAGAVSRAQHQSSLDSATDAAKRSVGRHMYLVMMQYVKLQLEADVSRSVREALEPAVNSIFDITPPEVRKILNDSMDGSGRAILREMYKRYTRFGKWSGV